MFESDTFYKKTFVYSVVLWPKLMKCLCFHLYIYWLLYNFLIEQPLLIVSCSMPPSSTQLLLNHRLILLVGYDGATTLYHPNADNTFRPSLYKTNCIF